MKVYRWCGLVQPFLCVFVYNISLLESGNHHSPYLTQRISEISCKDCHFWMFMQLCTNIKEVITVVVFRHCIYDSFGKCFKRARGYWAELTN